MFVERFIGWMDTAENSEKAAATNALARAYLVSDMGDEERYAAEAAMTVLLDDPDITVREALANAFATSTNSPRHIVLALADDEECVSLPILMKSPVLLECELNAHILKGTQEQQFAIACRPYIAASTSEYIAQHANSEACLALLLNEGACVSAEAFIVISKRHGDNDDVRSCLLARHDVPMDARLLLIEKYAMALLDDELPASEAETQKRAIEVQEACDKAIITFAAQVSEQEIAEIVSALIASSKLNTAFLLRAICMGNIALFANALSILAQVPLDRVERVLADDRRKVFNAIYQRSQLPEAAFSVFHFAINSWRKALLTMRNDDNASLAYFVTRETLSNYHSKENESGPIVDQLLMLLRRICTHAARESARNQIQMINQRIAVEAENKALLLEAKEAELPLSQEDMVDFAVNLADELADQVIAQEASLKSYENKIVTSNTNEPKNSNKGLLDQAA